MRDAFTDFDHDPSAVDQPPAPVRTSLLALFGRLGATGGWRGRTADGAEPLADAYELDLVLPDAAVTAPKIAGRAQTRLRDEARAAYASVVGSHEAAPDAALAVIEAEWRAAASERDRYAEALKAKRLYSGDSESRQRARRALEGRSDMPCAAEGGTMRERPRASAAGPIPIAALGAAALAALSLSVGGGLLLALLAYSLGAATLLLGAVTAAAYRPAAARRVARAPARFLVVRGLRHG